MDQNKPASDAATRRHLEFIKERLANTDFKAAEKLQRIEDLADIVFVARQNYRKNRYGELKAVKQVGLLMLS